MSLAVLLAQHNDVTVLDIDAKRVGRINNKQPTVANTEIELFLIQKSLSLTATLDKQTAYEAACFIIVATPTNYDANTNPLDSVMSLPGAGGLTIKSNVWFGVLALQTLLYLITVSRLHKTLSAASSFAAT